jgi:type VI secretion system protein ImpA
MSLDINALLQDISPDQPCGEYLQDSAEFFALESKRQGTPEDIFAKRPAMPPNWKEVRGDAIKLLGQTHDLRIALALAQALIHTDGLLGLRDGLALLRGMVENYWDGLYPNLDPEDHNDPTERFAILGTLCDFNEVLQPVVSANIVESPKVGRFSLRHWRIATGKLPAPKPPEQAPEVSTIQAAFTDAPLDSLKTLHGAVSQSIADATQIEAFATDQATGNSQGPNLSALVSVLREIRHLLDEQLAARGETEVSTEETDNELDQTGQPASATTQSPTGKLGAINSRQDVARALDLICEYYARCEPSSPVPLLLQRAKKLAFKDFMEIIRELAPDGLSQIQVITGVEDQSE